MAIHPTAQVHPGAKVDPTAEIGAGTVVEEGATIEAGARIGDDCEIRKSCRIMQNAEVGDGSVVQYGAEIHRGAQIGKECTLGPISIIRDDAKVGDGTTTHRNCVVVWHAEVGQDCVLKEGSRIGAYASIGERTHLGEGSTLENQAHIGSDCKIEEGCHIREKARVGDECTLGKRTDIGFGAETGQGCKTGWYSQVGDAACLGDEVQLESDVRIGRRAGIDEKSLVKNGSTIAADVHIGPRSYIGTKASVAEGVDAGPESRVGEGATIERNVKLSPGTDIARGATVRVNGTTPAISGTGTPNLPAGGEPPRTGYHWVEARRDGETIERSRQVLVDNPGVMHLSHENAEKQRAAAQYELDLKRTPNKAEISLHVVTSDRIPNWATTATLHNGQTADVHRSSIHRQIDAVEPPQYKSQDAERGRGKEAFYAVAILDRDTPEQARDELTWGEEFAIGNDCEGLRQIDTEWWELETEAGIEAIENMPADQLAAEGFTRFSIEYKDVKAPVYYIPDGAPEPNRKIRDGELFPEEAAVRDSAPADARDRIPLEPIRKGGDQNIPAPPERPAATAAAGRHQRQEREPAAPARS